MRVSSRMLNQVTLNQLQTVWKRVQDLQMGIATGRRIQRPSDDPTGAGHVMRTQSHLRANEQLKRNLAEVRQFASATESAVLQVVDLADTVRVIATRVADDSLGPAALAGTATELDGLLEEILGLANTNHAGMRLFGGYQTRESPFVAEEDGEGRIVAVRAEGRGLEGELDRLVGENLLLTINLTGTDLFGGDLEFFSHLVMLRDAALAGDRATARELLSSLDEDLDRINLAQALTGGLLSRVDGLEDRLERQALELEATRSEYEDLDVARAVLDYEQEQAILETALAISGRLMDLSLVQFLQ